jgi:hypothetical protein
VNGKVATLPGGEERFTAEYENCHAIAARRGIALTAVAAAAEAAFQARSI